MIYSPPATALSFLSSNQLSQKKDPTGTSSPSRVMALPSSWANQKPFHFQFFSYHLSLTLFQYMLEYLTCSASSKLLLLRSTMTFSSYLMGTSYLSSQQRLTLTVDNSLLPAFPSYLTWFVFSFFLVFFFSLPNLLDTLSKSFQLFFS